MKKTILVTGLGLAIYRSLLETQQRQERGVIIVDSTKELEKQKPNYFGPDPFTIENYSIPDYEPVIKDFNRPFEKNCKKSNRMNARKMQRFNK